jgi:YaiO family outer membrane protein
MRTARTLLALAAIALLPHIALADASVTTAASPSPSPAPVVEVQTGVSHESLNHDYPSWDTEYLRVLERADAQTVYAELSSTSRFDKSDDQLLLGAYVPLSADWTAFGEMSTSNTHYVLPSISAMLGVQYDSGSSWFEGMAFRHTDYDSGSVNSAIFSLEHYWRFYRFRYALTAAHLSGSGTDADNSFELDRYYGAAQQNSVGIGYVTGRELDNIGLPVLVTSHVHGVNVSGRQWVSRTLGLMYSFGSFTQGSIYTRSGGYLGLDYRF